MVGLYAEFIAYIFASIRQLFNTILFSAALIFIFITTFQWLLVPSCAILSRYKTSISSFSLLFSCFYSFLHFKSDIKLDECRYLLAKCSFLFCISLTSFKLNFHFDDWNKEKKTGMVFVISCCDLCSTWRNGDLNTQIQFSRGIIDGYMTKSSIK